MPITQKQSRALILAVLFVAILLGGGLYYMVNRVEIPDRTRLSGKPELEASYDKALKHKAIIEAGTDENGNYLAEGAAWKMIGDATKDVIWHKLALKAYEDGIAVTDEKNTLFLTNAGQIAETIGDYDKAKDYYEMAIDLSPGDVSYYLMYIHLMRYKLEAKPDEILAAYANAVERVLGGADLISSRSQYFKALGRYDEMKKDLELLLKNNVITQAQFDGELNEVARIKENQQ